MSQETKTLNLNFKCEDGKTATLAITEPKSGVTSEAIREAMGKVITARVIGSKTALYSEAIGAELVSRTVEEVYHA